MHYSVTTSVNLFQKEEHVPEELRELMLNFRKLEQVSFSHTSVNSKDESLFKVIANQMSHSLRSARRTTTRVEWTRWMRFFGKGTLCCL